MLNYFDTLRQMEENEAAKIKAALEPVVSEEIAKLRAELEPLIKQLAEKELANLITALEKVLTNPERDATLLSEAAPVLESL
jgi:hypothetical protein